MANKTCSQCGSTYNPETVEIPSPLLDGMCFECGTVHSSEDLENIIPEHIKQSLQQTGLIDS